MNEVDRHHLENFLMNIDILDELNPYLSDFNAFEMLGIVNTEIRHSNVLAWLMDPNENHALQDAFLKRFIQQIFYNFREIPHTNLTLFDLLEMNFNTFMVRREWQYIDLLIYSETHNLVIAIENKVWSKESKQQLKQYKSVVQNYFPQYHTILLFLTPEGEESSDSENWLGITYSFILEILDKVITLKKDTISEPVKYFINQYREVVRRYIVGDKELEEICRNIYFKHQKALDLIYEFKPDMYSVIAEHVEEKIKGNDQLILDSSTKRSIRFISKNLDDIIPRLDQGGTRSNRMLYFDVKNVNNRLALKMIIGPGDPEIRQAIHKMAKHHEDTFQNVLKKLTSQFTQIYRSEILQKNFEDEIESIEEIKDEIDEKFDKFLNNDLIEIERVLESEKDIFSADM